MTCDVKTKRVLEARIAYAVQREVEDIFRFHEKKIVVIAGPTGVGKTACSLKLAQAINGEIVSIDSQQVYRGMDIGTAKASLQERTAVPHHLIDIRNVTDPFNVVDFYHEALHACKDIILRGKVPIAVGGTGFYLHALIYGPPEGPPSCPEIRKTLEEDAEKFGIELLFGKLQEYDPEYAASITKSDAHKIIRALEIIELSRKKVSAFTWKEKVENPAFDWRCWFLHMPRKLLYQKIEERCDAMLAQGFLQEVIALDRAGIRQNKTAAQAIGYKQSLAFLDTAQSSQDYEQFVAAFKTASRHLIKKQLTWFQKEPLFTWLDVSTYSEEQVVDIIKTGYEHE